MARIKLLNWLKTASAAAGDEHTAEMVPIRSEYRPMFFAKDCVRKKLIPRSAKRRKDWASLSRLPVANP